MSDEAHESPSPQDDLPVGESEPTRTESEAGEEGPREEAGSSGSGPVKAPWADRWWVWALGGLALAAFIGLMHLTSGG